MGESGNQVDVLNRAWNGINDAINALNELEEPMTMVDQLYGMRDSLDRLIDYSINKD